MANSLRNLILAAMRQLETEGPALVDQSDLIMRLWIDHPDKVGLAGHENESADSHKVIAELHKGLEASEKRSAEFQRQLDLLKRGR